MKTVKDAYFKQGGYISGIELPLIVSETLFIHCRFHPNITEVCFERCVFEFCEGEEYIIHTKDCIFLKGD